jgi:hypothetical protein
MGVGCVEDRVAELADRRRGVFASPAPEQVEARDGDQFAPAPSVVSVPTCET